MTSERLKELFRDYNPLDVHVKTNMAGRSRGAYAGSRLAGWGIDG